MAHKKTILAIGFGFTLFGSLLGFIISTSNPYALSRESAAVKSETSQNPNSAKVEAQTITSENSMPVQQPTTQPTPTPAPTPQLAPKAPCDS
jgi:hypothetical protein